MILFGELRVITTIGDLPLSWLGHDYELHVPSWCNTITTYGRATSTDIQHGMLTTLLIRMLLLSLHVTDTVFGLKCAAQCP